MPRALLLVNKRARSGGDGVEAALAVLREGGVELIEPDADADVADAIRAHRARCDMVIAGGGDGTMNRIAPSLLETGLPLGLLPMGTGNDLARTLAIPFDLTQAAGVIVGGRLRDIDLGEVNGHPFFNVASLGLSVTVANNLDPETKRRFGRIGYVLASLRVMATARPFSVAIDDGEHVVRALTYQVAVGNGRYYGGGNAVHHAAEIDDGTLHLYSLELSSVWKLAAIGPFFRGGYHDVFKEVRTIHSDMFEIRTSRPRSINADGEIVTKTPAKVRLLRNALRVFVPEDAPTPLIRRLLAGEGK